MSEAWLEGPVPGVPAPLMPVAHSLLDGLDDLERASGGLTGEELWMRPGGAPSVGFHLQHVAGSTRRLLTYARGEGLSPRQLAEIPVEGEPGPVPPTVPQLLEAVRQAVSEALDVLRATHPDALDEPRGVGRSQRPSTVRGLLFHLAEHARRHAGQVVATASIVRGLGPAASLPAPRKVQAAVISEALRAHEEAGVRGLCAEGRWEVALDAMRALDPGSCP